MTGETMRATTMLLNGKPLHLSDEGALPDLEPQHEGAGEVELPCGSCSFFVM